MASIYEQLDIIQKNMENSIETKIRNVKIELQEGKATNLLIHEQMKLLYYKLNAIKQILKENTLKNDRPDYVGLPKRYSIESLKHIREEKTYFQDGYESDNESDDEELEAKNFKIEEKPTKSIYKTLSIDQHVQQKTNLDNVRPILRQIKMLCRKIPKSKLIIPN